MRWCTAVLAGRWSAVAGLHHDEQTTNYKPSCPPWQFYTSKFSSGIYQSEMHKDRPKSFSMDLIVLEVNNYEIY